MSFLRDLYFFQGQKYTSFGKNILLRQSTSLGHSSTGHTGDCKTSRNLQEHSFEALIHFHTDREALGEELEVVDERLHGGLHLGPARGNTLGVVRPHVAWNMSEGIFWN